MSKLVNHPAMQPILRAMAEADDDQVGMSRIAHMLEAAARLGFVLAPIEPTEEMYDAAWHEPNPEYGSLHMPPKNYRAIYQAMLRVRPGTST